MYHEGGKGTSLSRMKKEEEEGEEECLACCSNSYRNNCKFTFWATAIMPAMAGCIELQSQYRKSSVTTHHLSQHIITSEITVETSTEKFGRFHF
jgi:hypothetical protein